MSAPLNQQRLSLYHIEWQSLRVQLLGKWSTLEGAMDNLRLLQNYISTATMSDSTEMAMTRYYQVVNLLDAVRMSNHATGTVGSDADLAIQQWREPYQIAYRTLRLGIKSPTTFVVPTMKEVIEDCQLIGRIRTWEILDNLHKRKQHALRRSGSSNAYQRIQYVSDNRPELLWAISTIEHALETMP